MARGEASGWRNQLFYGDNLEVLRRDIPTESVDLIYLDPPFNSNRNYNVLFQHKDGTKANAQIQAFGDTWTWSQDDEVLYLELIGGGGTAARVADAIAAFYKLLGPSDMMSYLVMMASRLLELHRVLKPTGSLYLHCDPVASHYLKLLLDAIFGPDRFMNEISWQRSGAKNDPKRYGRSHDVVFFYTKSKSFTWNVQYIPYEDASVKKNYTMVEEGTGRRYRHSDLTAGKPGGDVDFEWQGVRPYKGRFWAYSRQNLDQMLAEGRIEFRRTGMPVLKRYLDEQPGVPLQDIWTDIRLTSSDKERLGYPTQKPLALLERIIAASSNEGDVVLDPFCGCGTAVDAAQRLYRRWIGIDITWLAVDLIESRLEATFGHKIRDSYVVHGIPNDLEGAQALFKANPFDFERWAVSFVDGQPNEKQVGDRGIDGRVRFWTGEKEIGQMVVSVKGGQTVNPAMVRDLVGTVQRESAEMGLLITLTAPTKGMIDEANKSGTFTQALTNRTYPKVQLITVKELLEGKRPAMPEPLNPYIKAKPAPPDQLSLI
jgi:DNA modification methylase